MFSTHSMKYIWYSPQKSKYPLFIKEIFINIDFEKKSVDNIMHAILPRMQRPRLCYCTYFFTFSATFKLSFETGPRCCFALWAVVG